MKNSSAAQTLEAPPVTPLITGVAWSGNSLIATDPDVVDKRIRRKALSASTGKSMKGCLAGFAASKLLPREDDPFSVSELGTSTHAVIEDLYNLPAADRTKDAFIALRDVHSAKKWSDDELAKTKLLAEKDPAEWAKLRSKWDGEVVRLGAPVFDIEDPRQVNVHKTEMAFDGVTIAGGVPAMGYIDRVDIIEVRGRERYKAVDLKTGKMKSAFDLRRYGDDHGDQIRIYTDAIYEMLGVAPAEGSIHYTQFGTSREIPLTEMAMEKTRKDFRTAWDTHNRVTDEGKFPTTVGPLCSWCPVVNSCPAAAAAGKTPSDRLPKEPLSAVQLGIPTVRRDAKPMGSKLPPTNPIVSPAAANAAVKAIASAPAKQTIPVNDQPPVDPYESETFAPQPAEEIVVNVALLETLRTQKANPAAHVSGEETDNNGKGNLTVTTNQIFSEGKPWEPTINGKLNGASYAAMAVTSIPQIAGELLVAAGRPLNGQTIDRLTDLLATIIIDVQKSVRGEFDWADGINTRIRGALRTTIETLPLPWDSTSEQAWADWQQNATKRTYIFIKKALRLYELGDTIPAASFAALLPGATDTKPRPGVQRAA